MHNGACDRDVKLESTARYANVRRTVSGRTYTHTFRAATFVWSKTTCFIIL